MSLKPSNKLLEFSMTLSRGPSSVNFSFNSSSSDVSGSAIATDSECRAEYSEKQVNTSINEMLRS